MSDNKKKKSPSNKPKRWVACPIEEEYFGSDVRKAGRQERKRITAKDRSKYKKTDAKMLEKETIDPEGLCRGRVLSIESQGITVDYNNENYTCFLRGVLKKDRTLDKNLVTVGDFVLFEEAPDKEGYIAHIESRRSTLSRADNLSRKKQQLIAANIDQVIITVSLITPPLKPPLIDRYIIATRKGNMTPILVINKTDLLVDTYYDEDVRQKEAQLYKGVIDAYSKAEIPFISTCVETGEGLDELRSLMKGKASVFSGQSGVGKSSLINAMTGLELPIGDVVEKTRKGAHTTTSAQLIRLDCGGFCIDTPGIKSFGVWDLEPEDIQSYYSEILNHSADCKFHNCTHTHEKDCSVTTAVEEGKISEIRYESYKNLINTIRQEHKKR